MIFGIALTSVTFIALILSIIGYYLYHLRSEQVMLKIARNSFYLASGLVLVQAALLMYGILNHYFDWIYVFSYSSKDLPLNYLISTFWAGQEGTFLLWMIYGSAYGIFIISFRKKDEPLVMVFMALIQAFLALILIKKNPFMYVWQVNPGAFPVDAMPFDGNGLNPLLQDPWMVIHPPVLFSGYASTMILFSFAMAALIKKQHDDWIKNVYPFALYSAMILGTGIIMGGYWAYTTLGWGGYWGWDPVENSSFIPWLVCLALVHGIMVQRRQGGMKRLNIFLAIMAFVFVLYGSFLTRSGILTDFSVHSFGESEISVYLAAFLFLFTGIGLITYIFRVKGVKGEKVDNGFFTRELFMSFGMMFILLLAVFTFFGTSWPLFSSIFLEKPESVDLSVYNKIAGPLAILIGLLIALAPVLSWKRSNAEKLKSIVLQFSVSVVIGIGLFFLGIRDLIPLMIISVAVFILLVNGEIVYRMISKKTYAFGGYLAHVGIGLMLIGIITSSVYNVSEKITLPLNENISILGYDIRYDGKQTAANGKDKVLLTINNQDETFARFYWSEYNKAYMVAPSVVNNFLEDLYISPIQIIEGNKSHDHDDVKIHKKDIVKYENLTFRFAEYEMNSHNMANADMTILANIEILDENGSVLQNIKPGIKISGDKKEALYDVIPGTTRTIAIEGLSVEDETLTLSISKDQVSGKTKSGKELLAVEVSKKPLINILWLGTIVLFAGFITTIFNRTQKQSI